MNGVVPFDTVSLRSFQPESLIEAEKRQRVAPNWYIQLARRASNTLN